MEDMVECMRETWNNYDSNTLSAIWGQLLATYRAIIEDGGGNRFKQPHEGMHKRVGSGGAYCDYKCTKEMFAKAKSDMETMKPNVKPKNQ